jgi:hypothetical protein
MMAGQQDNLPGFKQGFARSAGESEYPELWRGLAGAWCPALGVQGERLFDPTRQGAPGTVANGSWASSPAGIGLSFNGASTVVNLGRPVITTADFTVAAWVKCNDVSYQDIFSQWASGQTGRLEFGIAGNGSGTLSLALSGTPVVYTSAVVGGTGFHHCAVTRRAGTIQLYVDGRPDGTCFDTVGIYQANGRLGTYSSGAWLSGVVHLAAAWSRALTGNELVRLSCDPPAPFRLRRQNFASALRRPSAAYRRVLASVYGVSP